ncbi:type I polyketide synthase, partial [Streptomonospora algeriensis]
MVPVGGVENPALEGAEPGQAPDGAAGEPDGRREREFWHAVEREDLSGLRALLGLAEDAPPESLLPALSAWRRRSTADSCAYGLAWSPRTLRPGTPAGRWLVVAPHGADEELDAVLRQLHRAGTEAVAVSLDATACDRASAADTLRACVPDGVASAEGIISLLGLEERARSGSPGISAGPAATVCLVQALDDLGAPGRLWLVTRDAVAAGQVGGRIRPDQAAVWGMGRVLGLERPDRFGGLVDLPEQVEAPIADAFAAVLTGQDDEDQFAVRPEGVLVPRIVRARLPGGDREWRTGATALIT